MRPITQDATDRYATTTPPYRRGELRGSRGRARRTQRTRTAGHRPETLGQDAQPVGAGAERWRVNGESFAVQYREADARSLGQRAGKAEVDHPRGHQHRSSWEEVPGGNRRLPPDDRPQK